MKILFVLGFPNPFPGAGWTRVGFFANAWSEKGRQIEVLGAFSYKSLHKKGAEKMGRVNIFNLVFNIGLNHPLIFALNSAISFMVSIFFLTVRKPNIAVISVPTGDIGLGALMACKLTRVKCVVDCRDEWEDYTISLTNSKVERVFYSTVKKLLTHLYAKSQLVTTVTPNFLDSLKRRGVTNVRLVPNGADVTVFSQLDKTIMRRKLRLSNSDFIIVYNGVIGGYYKFDRVLTALTKLVRQIKNAKLLMIGYGPDVSKVLTSSKNLGLTGNVLYLGVKDDKKEIAEILSAGDIGLIPGLYAKGQLPVKLFEYCACGLPVVASVYSDSMLAKLIMEYNIGVTVPPVAEEQLAEAFYQLYKNESFRETAGKTARMLIEEEFDRNKIAERFLNLITECAG